MSIQISILTVFKRLYEPFLQTSLVRRAHEKGLVHIEANDFFSYVNSKERIDASTFGPGSGMLIRPEVVERAIEDKEKKRGEAYKVFFSPQGKKMDQRLLENIAVMVKKRGHLMLIPARYEGMDARAEEYYADMVVSAGDFVLMGGDIPAMMFLEGFLRLIPGVVGKEESVKRESFSGPFVDYPAYTEPVDWKKYLVPDIVRSGNHGAIAQWRMQQAAQKSVLSHFDWLRSQHMTDEQQKYAQKYIPPHYLVLLHSDVLIGEKKDAGVTSVTSIDIHDIARSSAAYGLKNFFIVTPLADQKKIVQRLLDFWKTGCGSEYNKNRHQAIMLVKLYSTIDKVIDAIQDKEGKSPLLIATSARNLRHTKQLSFHDQSLVWQEKRPILFVLGTGKGLTDHCISRCDFLLTPIRGFSDFSHLSVRSAAAVILDRWLGINLQKLKNSVE